MSLRQQVSVSADTHAKVRALSQIHRKSCGAVVEEAVSEALRRDPALAARVEQILQALEAA